MADETRGPSYWDVSTFVDDLRTRWNYDFSFRVCPPVRIVSTGKWTSWHVWCEVRATAGYGPILHTTGATYGQNGAWKTLPAAMFQALCLTQDALYDAERAAREQAAF